jgi:hypothetical protein
MTPVEVIALAGALIVPIKIIVILTGQNVWFENVTKRYWKNAATTTLLSLLAVAVLLFFLLQELTIVQIWAAATFGMALVSLALAPFSKHMISVERKWFTETNVLMTGWVPGVVWLALVVWVLYAVFE